MESFLESPVVQWFLALRCPTLAQLTSPFAFYVECLPACSTIVAAIAVALLSRSLVESTFVGDVFGVLASWFFLRYLWFHGFVFFRHFCEVYLDMRRDFTRIFVEPGLAAIIAASLLFRAWRRTKKLEPVNRALNGFGDGNVNNSAINRVHSLNDLPPSSTDLNNNVNDDLLLLGQLHYCQRCGKIMYETIADPVVSGQSPTIPPALIIGGDGRASQSASPSRELRCENCLRIQSSNNNGGGWGEGGAVDGRGGGGGNDVRSVNFAVGPHNLGETRPKGILRNPRN